MDLGQPRAAGLSVRAHDVRRDRPRRPAARRSCCCTRARRRRGCCATSRPIVPEAEVTVVERDPGVIAFARERFLHQAQDRPRRRRRHRRRRAPRLRSGDGRSLRRRAAAPASATSSGRIARRGAPPRRLHRWSIGRAAGPAPASTARRSSAWRSAIPPLAGSILLSERVVRGNIVQLAPSAPGFRVTSLAPHIRVFAEARNLPREDRTILLRCDVTRRYPAPRRTARLAPAPGSAAGRGGKNGQ